MLNALTVDFEDWYHPELLKGHLTNLPREERAGRVVTRLLDQLDRHGSRCTFFLLSETLSAHAGVVKDIAARGHEIGFHGHTHTMLDEHTPESFDEEIKKFFALLAELGISARTIGYRAPTFSLNTKTAWALDVLERNGFLYDSSIFPLANGVYGVRGAPRTVYHPDPADIRNDRGRGILEFPMSTAKWGPFKIPVAGGFYFRVLPFSVSRRLLESINREGHPFVFYFHPWELDPGIPRAPVGWLRSYITYTGLGEMEAKLERLLDSFEFTRLDDVLGV